MPTPAATVTTPWDGPVAAALLLQEPGLPGGMLVAASLKELVLRGAVRLEARPRTRFLGIARKPRHVLFRGTLPSGAPAPLPYVHGRLKRVRRGPGREMALRDVGRRFGELGVGGKVRDSVRDGLLAKGLIEPRARRFRGEALVRTPKGEAMLSEVLARKEAVQAAIAEPRGRDARAVADSAAALAGAGTLVILVPGAVDELALGWSAWRRRVGADPGGVPTPTDTAGADAGGDGGAWAALADMPADVLDALGDSFGQIGDAFGDAFGSLDALTQIDGGFSGFDGSLGIGAGFDGGGGDGGGDGGGGDGGGGGD